MKKRRHDPFFTRTRAWGMLAMLLCMHAADADGLAVTAGRGNLKSQGSYALLFSYLKDAPRLFNRDGYYELSFGYWSGSTYNSVLTLARGMRWKISPGYYFAGTLGIGVIERTTDHLGTQGQFTLRLAVGRKFGKYDLSIGETHYSNGQKVFHWHGPNVGEDFLTVRLAREL
jgi:Lipid A 3-O-deacylase (PagL)